MIHTHSWSTQAHIFHPLFVRPLQTMTKRGGKQLLTAWPWTWTCNPLDPMWGILSLNHLAKPHHWEFLFCTSSGQHMGPPPSPTPFFSTLILEIRDFIFSGAYSTAKYHSAHPITQIALFSVQSFCPPFSSCSHLHLWANSSQALSLLIKPRTDWVIKEN